MMKTNKTKLETQINPLKERIRGVGLKILFSSMARCGLGHARFRKNIQTTLITQALTQINPIYPIYPINLAVIQKLDNINTFLGFKSVKL